MGKVIRHTYSLCPVCLRSLPAEQVEDEQGAITLQKTCPQHGFFSAPIWRNQLDLESWRGNLPELEQAPPCPTACGLCSEHLQGTCCVVLEVTGRCNLHCPFCFAAGGDGSDVALAELLDALPGLAALSQPLLQLSGGEPTLRDDLPQIIAAAKSAGIRYLQLNTNGIRLAESPAYLHALAEAGLSFVFLQFDGLQDSIYQQLRGKPLLDLKLRAIQNCAAEQIGVTLVPTLVPGVNVDAIGSILQFAFANSPAVRGVHFQPVSYFGRIPQPPQAEDRLTLDTLVVEIARQTGGRVAVKNLLPSRCDHPLCGFHGDFVIDENQQPTALSQAASGCGCSAARPVTAAQNRNFVVRRWLREKSALSDREAPQTMKTSLLRPQNPAACPQDAKPGDRQDAKPGDLQDLNYFARRVRSHGFTISAMAFQDAGTIDLERLRRCSLHVYEQGRLVPFCAHYLTPWN
ncbi:MAG: radical SAM protein [Negativicutes bacterium]|nr:radical SAM protein [Negativicutes bacterium]